MQIEIHCLDAVHTHDLDDGASLSIGRGHECDLYIPDSTISRSNLRVERKGQRLWLVQADAKPRQIKHNPLVIGAHTTVMAAVDSKTQRLRLGLLMALIAVVGWISLSELESEQPVARFRPQTPSALRIEALLRAGMVDPSQIDASLPGQQAVVCHWLDKQQSYDATDCWNGLNDRLAVDWMDYRRAKALGINRAHRQLERLRANDPGGQTSIGRLAWAENRY